jgi:protein-S-isoprenylcysteine O-methyltransferase Ste14
MTEIPLFVLTATIWAYWIGIGAMLVRVRRHRRKFVLMPEQSRERLMWIVWLPLVAVWCALPYLAQTHRNAPLALPAFARDDPFWQAIRLVAAIVGVGCLLATIRCWLRMGDDWRMGIESNQTALITDGPFARIRHPIYAFSILLMLCSAIVLPTWPMLAIAAIHIVLMNVKARNEEAHMAHVHGDSYIRYVSRTGRFWPRLTRT